MDSVTNWKKILLQWVIKCNLLEKNFYSLDQTEVETFFVKFKDRFKEGNICLYKNLSDFLKEEYPLFEPNFDDENTLSSSDHIYVYSLLLHFSCVKVSNAYFQEICKNLDDFSQRNITVFFEKLLNEESLTKETLRRVIAAIHGFTPPNSRTMYTVDSPMKTPRKNTDISPPTPKSSLLTEKNKKVCILNAQLDTLSYEKSVLEIDLKNYQDKIDKLSYELKRSNQEIQDLKNEILSKNKESNDSGSRQHSGEEQIRKLNKKIAKKEEEIAQQRDTIEELTGEKNILCEKLKKAENEMKNLQNNISYLANQVDEFSQELEQKDRQIQDLSETKDELEQFIKELRSSTSNSGHDLNTSSEFLDLSRVTNSSGSLHSPENLGSVVDIKLREKENENEKLREEISSIRIDNSKLSKAMTELTTKYSKLFDVCHDNLIIDFDDENPTIDNPANCFIIFSNYMQTFASKYEENCFELKRIKENERKVGELNLSLASKLDESQNLNVELRKEMDELKLANKTLQTSKENLEIAIAELENKFENCLKERTEEANNLKNLQKEMESLKIEKQDTENKVEYLTTCLDTKEDILTKLQSDSEDKDEIISENRQKLKELAEENQNLKDQLIESEILEKELREQTNNLNDQNQQLTIDLERSQDNFVAVTNEKNYLVTLTQGNQKQIDLLQQKIQTLTNDQALVLAKLETEKESLIASMQKKVHTFSEAIDKYEEGFELKARELSELTDKWRVVEEKCNAKENNLQEVTQQLHRSNEAFDKVTKCVCNHLNNLKSRIDNKTSLSSLALDDIDDLDSGFKEKAKALLNGIDEVSERVIEEKTAVSQKLSQLERTVEKLNEEKSAVELASSSNAEAFVEKEAVLQRQIALINSSIEKLEHCLQEKTKEAEMLSEKQKQAEEIIVRLESDLKLSNEKSEGELRNLKSQLEKEIAEKSKTQGELENAIELQTQLQDEKSFLENKLTVMGEEYSRNTGELGKEIENIQILFEKSSKQLESERTEKLTLKESLERTTHELNHQVAEAKQLATEFESTKLKLENEVVEKQKITKDLERKNIEFESHISKATTIKEELQIVKDEKYQIIDSITQVRTLFESELKNIKLQLETATSEAKIQFNNEIKEKQHLIEELQNAQTQLTAEKQTLQQQLESFQTEKNKEIQVISLQLESELARSKILTAELESARDEVEIKSQQLEELEETKSRLENEMQTLTVEVDKLRLALENETLEKSKFKEDFENTKIRLESEITEKDHIIEELNNVQNQKAKEKQQLQTLEAEKNNEIKQIVFQLESEVARTKILTSEVANAQANVEKKILLLKELEDTKSRLENEVKALQLDLENESVEKSKLEEEFKTTELQLNCVQSQLETLQTGKHEEVQKITLQLESEIAKTKILTSEIETKSQILKDLEETKTDLEKEVQSLRLALESETLERSKLKENFESTKLRLELEITEKDQIDERLKESQTQLESLNAEFKSKIAENLLLQQELEVKTQETSNSKDELTKARKALEELYSKISNLEGEYAETRRQRDIESASKAEIKNNLEVTNQELDELRTTILNLQAEHEAINQRSAQYKKQLDEVNAQLRSETTEKSQLLQDIENSKKQMSELSDQKTNLEIQHQESIEEVQKYKNLLASTDCEMKRLRNEESRLLREMETLKNTHETHIQKCNKEIDEQKENISRLIQEIASIRKEKEFAEEEKRILSNRLESKLNEQKSKETTQRSIEDKLQSAEKEVLIKLNLLKTEQLKSQDLENQLKKLQLETIKLRETAESNMKRIEKQALSLGESQAKCQKLKKEADAAQSCMEALKSTAEVTQRDNCRLNQECRTLKEKLTKCEKSKDQLESKIQTLQKQLDTLAEEKKLLENSENDLKISQGSLEKIKHNLEDKIRKLAKSLSDSNVAISQIEQDKVQLNLEVGGLNKQLQENKSLLNMKLLEIENLTSNLIEAKDTNAHLIELNEKHQIQAKEIHEENSRLNDQLSKLALRLEITQKEHEMAKSELERLKSDVETSQSERDAIEKDHRTAMERLLGVEERRVAEVDLCSKIKSLEAQITKLTIEKCDMEELRRQDKQIIEQLNKDISVFTAKLQKSRSICEENEKKWAEEKELLLADVKGSEERIKETRFELEGKLEKMKNKMKTLYNDEIAKMKKKQEREVAVYKTDIDSLKAKNEKHEEHIKKLSSQIFRLNENRLEFQKENTFLKTKLKDVESKPRQLSRLRPTSVPSSTHQVLSSNLRMEDEEGEIFNNTYLSDLKNGRMSEYFNTDICAQELQYRNSLVPPHLKSTYLAQFDHQMGEEEIRDVPSLDDSSSTLLNTGQRKKVSGATSYKRPGPPTPSKNAGRLSFGGIGELNREILKESHDSASCSSSSSKTPAKFKFFSSKLSMRGEERKSVLTNFKRKLQTGGGSSTIQCSSTPRKSKAHIDQRRLLDQIMSTASPGPNYSPADSIVKPAVNLPLSLKNLEPNRRISGVYKWRQPRLSYASDSGNSEFNSPRLNGGRYAASGSSGGSSRRRTHTKRAKDRRGSIYFRGTMFARNCRTPTAAGTRDSYKSKAKIHRIANFNKYRKQVLNDRASMGSNWDEDDDDDDNNNNNNDDFFMEDFNRKAKNKQQDRDSDENFNNDQSSKHFQKLLEAKESHAPFEISGMNSNQSFSNVNNSSSNVHSCSRTIYGASVILNRKIPHINTTMVRKSSIYVKGSDGKSVILVTNQTITLKDLAAMWFQMNFSTRSVIAIILTATLIGVLSIALKFMNR